MFFVCHSCGGRPAPEWVNPGYNYLEDPESATSREKTNKEMEKVMENSTLLKKTILRGEIYTRILYENKDIFDWIPAWAAGMTERARATRPFFKYPIICDNNERFCACFYWADS